MVLGVDLLKDVGHASHSMQGLHLLLNLVLPVHLHVLQDDWDDLPIVPQLATAQVRLLGIMLCVMPSLGTGKGQQRDGETLEAGSRIIRYHVQQRGKPTRQRKVWLQ